MCAGCGRGKPPEPAASRGSTAGLAAGVRWSIRRCDTLLPSARAGAQREPGPSPAKGSDSSEDVPQVCAFLPETLMGPKEAMMEGNPLNHVSSRAFPAEEQLKELWRLVFCTHPHREADGEERGNCHPASIWQTLRLCCNLG